MGEILKLSNLGTLSNVEYIDISASYTTGALDNIDISKLSNVKEVSVTYAELLNIQLPSPTSSLEKLLLNNNSFSNITISNHPALTTVDLLRNNLSSITLNNLPSLTSLYLAYNNFTAINLTNVPSLELIDLNNNFNLVNITGYDSCPNLKNLKCSRAQITSANLDNIVAYVKNGSVNGGVLDFSGCVFPSPAAMADINILVNPLRGWQVGYTPSPTATPKIEFTVTTTSNNAVFYAYPGMNPITVPPENYAITVVENELYVWFYGLYNVYSYLIPNSGVHNSYIYTTGPSYLEQVIFVGSPSLTVTNITGLENFPIKQFAINQCCNFDQAAVDDILVRMSNIASANSFNNGAVYLDGNNAAPSAIGLAAKAALIARGYTVVTN